MGFELIIFYVYNLSNDHGDDSQRVRFLGCRQLIEDMFQEEPSRDQPSLPREDISLNLTSTSRSTKMHNNRLSANDIAATAQAELAKVAPK